MNSLPRRLTRFAAPAGVATLALAVTGCGGGYSGGSSPSTSTPRATSQARAFAWLRPSPPPRAWHTGRLPGGVARLAYPPGWQSIRSDPGTFSAAVRGPSGEIRGYLYATPRLGAERLSNWASFRVDHKRDEGDVDVKRYKSRGALYVAVNNIAEFHWRLGQSRGPRDLPEGRGLLAHHSGPYSPWRSAREVTSQEESEDQPDEVGDAND